MAFTIGTGVFGVVTEVLNGASYICAPAVAMLNNSTRVVRTYKLVHTTIGYTLEAFEDTGTLIFLTIDLALFGQPIPTGKSSRYSNWGLSDIINDILGIGDND